MLVSCGGKSTFHEYARVGDTIAIPTGMQPNFNKDNITVTITPSSGPDIVLPATDPSIRAVVNLYTDPLASIKVSHEVGTDFTTSAQTYYQSVIFSAGLNKEWYQTTVFLDLPSNPVDLPLGMTQITVSNGVDSFTSELEVIPGTGKANTFFADIIGAGSFALQPDMLDGLSRVEHNTVSINSDNIPAAIEVVLSHDAGSTYLANSLGSQKSMNWSDDGSNIKVILMASKDGIIEDMNDYKFYVTGTFSSLTCQSATLYDINGIELDEVSNNISVDLDGVQCL